jgi:hypothetical protein
MNPGGPPTSQRISAEEGFANLEEIGGSGAGAPDRDLGMGVKPPGAQRQTGWHPSKQTLLLRVLTAKGISWHTRPGAARDGTPDLLDVEFG